MLEEDVPVHSYIVFNNDIKEVTWPDISRGKRLKDWGNCSGKLSLVVKTIKTLLMAAGVQWLLKGQNC